MRAFRYCRVFGISVLWAGDGYGYMSKLLSAIEVPILEYEVKHIRLVFQFRHELSV